MASIVVTVRIEAADRQVCRNRQSRLEASDRDHRLPLQTVRGRIDRRLSRQSRCKSCQIIGRITRHEQRGLSTIEPWHLRSISQRGESVTLRLVDAIPGCIGVIQRHRIRRIPTVGIGDALGRINVAKARE